MTRVPRHYNHDLTFVGVEGSWLHDYGDRLVREFRYLGYHAVWMSLDTDDPKKKSAGLGKDLRAKEEAAGLENIIRIAHSSGLTNAIQEADPEAVIGIHGVAGGLPVKSIVQLAGNETANLLADRYTPEFQAGIIWPSDGSGYLTQFRKNMVEQVFLDHRNGNRANIDQATRDMIVKRIRQRLRHPNDSVVTHLPDVELAYTALRWDNALKFREFQLPFARRVLGVEPQILDCGHTPMAECPKDLAELAVSTALGMKKRALERRAG
ncbi:MAG TPA: hypothetical protein VFP35_01045 [Candidatus Saccharimonadales bacterium]|nr:hypothetical protein [Candidatus Saccharimonadales bacterium]